MKKLIILMLIAFTLNASAQRGISFSSGDGRASSALIIGGVGFTLLGITSSLDWDYVGTKQVYRPIYRNGNSTVAVVTGLTLTITGLITLATEGKDNRRGHHRF